MKKLSILLLAMVALLFVGMYNAPTAQAAETNVSFDVTVVKDGDIVTLPALTGQYGKNMSFDAAGLLVENMEFAYHILNGKVIESPTHNVLVSGSSNLIVVIQSVGTEVTTFIDVNGKLLDANTTGQAPLNVPLKPGFDFDGFVDLEGTDKPVKVATYTRKTDVATIAVTVNGGSKDLVEVKYNDVVTLQPADMDNFKYWADANGKFVSSNPNYKFTALKDVTFEAVTVGDVPALTSVYMTSVDIRDGHESYLAQIELKEGDSLLEYGYLTSETEMGDIVVGAQGVEKISSTALNPLTNEFLMSFPLVKFLNIRAYALVDNGTTQIYVYNELSGSFASDLFISEYIEGSSNNKAIEIYNGTGQTVDLTNYSVGLYANGDSAGLFSSLSGTLAHGQTYVISNSSSNPDILSVSDRTYSYESGSFGANWNGDDAVALLKNQNIIDVIGVIGERPNKSWPVGTGATADYTLVRNSSVISPTSTWNTSEWDVSPQDTTTYLGTHAHDGGTLTLSDSQSILKDALSLPEFADIKADGSIELPSIGANGTTITWVADLPEYIDVDTKAVTVPADHDEIVTLTATISKGTLSKTVTRLVHIGLTDADRLAIENSIIAELELVDGSQFAGGSDVSLPSEIEGINILWTYNPSNLVVDGKFIEVDEDTSLTLTATFTVPGRDEVVYSLIDVIILASGAVQEPELLNSYNFLDGGSSNNSGYANTNLATNISYASDNPGGTSGTTAWIANYANLSLKDATRLGGKLVSTEMGAPSANIRTNFKSTSIITKVEILGAKTFGTASNLTNIYLQTSIDGTVWTTVSTKTIANTVSFDNLNIPINSYYRVVIELKASTTNSGLSFTGIKTYGFPQ